MRIYLDNCCLGRLFDEDPQPRIMLEAEAMTIILDGIRTGKLTWVGSNVLKEECSRNPNAEGRRRVYALLEFAAIHVELDSSDVKRADRLRQAGFSLSDALHLVAAAKGKCDVLLTTDDSLLRRARRLGHGQLGVVVDNPIDWLRKVTFYENA